MVRRLMFDTMGAPALAVMLSMGTAFAGEIPIAVTGYNQQVVIGSSTPITATVTGGSNISSGEGTFYQSGFSGSAPSTGLTSGTFTSLADSTTQGLLQSFTGNDAVVLNSANTTATLTLTLPSAYSSLSFFASSAVGSSTLDYQLNYVGAAPITGSLTIADWYSATGAAIIAGGYAAAPNGPAMSTPGDVEILQLNLPGPLNSLQSLASINLTYDTADSTAGSNVALFGVSGAVSAVPEPASLALLAVGLVGLGIARRQKVS